MPAQGAIPPRPLGQLITAVSAAAATASATFSLPIADSYYLFIAVSAATGTSPTMDVCYETSVDGGTTYIDLPLRHAQITASSSTDGGNGICFRNGLGQSEVAVDQVTARTGGTLAKACCFDPAHMKVTYTIGGTSPAFTFKLWGFAVPSPSR